MKLLFLAFFSLLSFNNNPEVVEKNYVEISAITTDSIQNYTTPWYEYPEYPEEGDYDRLCTIRLFNTSYDYSAKFSLEFRYYDSNRWQKITVVVAPASNGYCGSKKQTFSKFVYLNHNNCTFEYIQPEYGGYY